MVFFAGRAETGGTANLYDDVKIERVLTNPVLLKYIPSELSTRKTPQISFNKISTTKYEVQISAATDPYFLVFSESFHPGWKLSVEGEHLVMNGFANGWYITKPGNYKMTIEFTPQRIYYLGAGVSLTAFVILLALILTRRVK